MTGLESFGIRSVPPCRDCHDDGTCAMNCSPRDIDPDRMREDRDERNRLERESLPWQTAKARSEIVCRPSARRGRNEDHA